MMTGFPPLILLHNKRVVTRHSNYSSLFSCLLGAKMIAPMGNNTIGMYNNHSALFVSQCNMFYPSFLF